MMNTHKNNDDTDESLIKTPAFEKSVSNQIDPPFLIIETVSLPARADFYSKNNETDGFLILYTQSGRGLLKYKKDEYLLEPGSIALIDCQEYHEYRTYNNTDGNWLVYRLHFTGKSIKFYSKLIYGDSFNIFNLGDKPFHIIEGILKNLRYNDLESLFFLNDSIYKLIVLMVEESRIKSNEKNGRAPVKEKISKAVKYIEVNYWQPFILDEIANLFNTSKFHFIKLFKEFTGMTPYSFLIAKRINVAKTLLQTTDLKVSEISIMVGFGDESNFVRTFKSISGMTPKKYRLDIWRNSHPF